MKQLKNFFEPLTTAKAIGSVFGFGIVLISVGAFVNALDPNYDYIHGLDRWYPGYTVITIGAAFFILNFVLRLIGVWTQDTNKPISRSLSGDEVANAIDHIAEKANWIFIAVAVAAFAAGQYFMIPWLEAVGGTLIVLSVGLFTWKYFFRV